jgi:hypothetical protein
MDVEAWKVPDDGCAVVYVASTMRRASVSCSEGISPGSVGFFCHTDGDGCVDDTDCGAQGEAACIFLVDAGKWSCFTLMCFD